MARFRSGSRLPEELCQPVPRLNRAKGPKDTHRSSSRGPYMLDSFSRETVNRPNKTALRDMVTRTHPASEEASVVGQAVGVVNCFRFGER